MPQEIERCVASLLQDKEFMPMKDRTREESAYAICYARQQKQDKVISTLREGEQVPR